MGSKTQNGHTGVPQWQSDTAVSHWTLSWSVVPAALFTCGWTVT